MATTESIYTEAEVKLNNGTGACLCNECRVILSYGFEHENKRRYCAECYDKLYNFIQYIANDYFELSYEKVRIQRDDYVRMARDLIKQRDEE